MPVSKQHFAPPVVENTLSHLDPVANWLQLTSACCTPLASFLFFGALALRRPCLHRFPGFCCLFLPIALAHSKLHTTCPSRKDGTIRGSGRIYGVLVYACGLLALRRSHFLSTRRAV